MNWNIEKEDAQLINAIAKRAYPEVKACYKSLMDLEMDITTTHLNGNPLNLKQLAEADDTNLFHDIYGIYSHLNRTTGELENCFVPRLSQHAAVL